MRKLVVVGLFFACASVVPSAFACDAGGGDAVVVTVTVSAVAMQQSQTFLASATALDGKAAIEEAASGNVLATARARRKKAAAIRVQAFQVSEPSRGALLARADKLSAEAAVNDVESATYLKRARAIRGRAGALRALSTRVLASGAVSAQTLARVQLPAAPMGHPDPMALTMLEAAPKAPMTRRIMSVAGI